jgi:hypothetical protein
MKRKSKQLENDDVVGGLAKRISWQSAFIQAMKMELREYEGVLDFYDDHRLTEEPLRIDCVVIKKTENVQIKKNIAAIFREHNLIEYKSPGDYVSVADFYKVYAYACLYASIEEVPITSLTLSFVESRYPRRARKPKGLLLLSDTVDVIVRRDYANHFGSTPLTGRFSGPPGNCSAI